MQTAADRKNPDIGQRLLTIKTAADHAARAHKGQFRKDRTLREIRASSEKKD